MRRQQQWRLRQKRPRVPRRSLQTTRKKKQKKRKKQEADAAKAAAELPVAESPTVSPVREPAPDPETEPEPDTETQAEPDPQAEVSLVRELEPELAAELEFEPAAEPEPQLEEVQEPEQQQGLAEPEPEPAVHVELPQAMSDWSEHTTLQWASDQMLAPAASAALLAAFVHVQEETDGDDPIVLSMRRLEKMLARKGCDDGDTVAQPVLAARDAMPKKTGKAATLTEMAQHGDLDCEICFERHCSAEQRTPRLLPCGHTFCESCLDDMASSAPSPNKGKQQQIGCPACRTPAEVPKGGVRHLLKNYLVDSMADAARKLGA